MSQLKKTLEKITSNWKQTTKTSLAQHPVAILLRQEFKKEIDQISQKFDSTYRSKVNLGGRTLTKAPSIAIFDPQFSQAIQANIYLVYLFRADGSGLYLSLSYHPHSAQNNRNPAAVDQAAQIKQCLLNGTNGIQHLKDWGQTEIDLKTKAAQAKSDEQANIVAKFYGTGYLPTESELRSDLTKLLKFYKQIIQKKMTEIGEIVGVHDGQTRQASSEASVNRLSEATKADDIGMLALSKPFILLAGISGTGKTRFIRQQAGVFDGQQDTYRLVCVRPDWHEPSDLLGYVSRLSGDVIYVVTDTLTFIVAAWQEIQRNAPASIKLTDDSGLIKPSDSPAQAAQITLSQGDLATIRPFWLCLDEMNLAPVEQYFADYLSVLETRAWHIDGDDQSYYSDPLIKAAVLKGANQQQLRNDLGLNDPEDNELWQYFCTYGIGLPFNLIVAGTVNMDETTHGLSRKVIDRALSIDFNQFFPNDYAHFFQPTIAHKSLSYPIWSDGRDLASLSQTFDSDGLRSVAFLTAINSVLMTSPFELAYRALNELLIWVIACKPQTPAELFAVWDDFVMCKVLPRIEGDMDKLQVRNGKSQHHDRNLDDKPKTILEALVSIMTQQGQQLLTSEQLSASGKIVRPDLYRFYLLAHNESAKNNPNQPGANQSQVQGGAANQTIWVACRSVEKLQWMQDRLLSATFTSFWP